MATLASTNITSNISPNAEQPVAFGDSGLIVEFFRVALGAAADTIVITPRWITNIRAVSEAPPASNNLTTNANTNVTLTLLASGATNATADVQIVGQR